MLIKKLKLMIGPTMMFGLDDMLSLYAPHNDPLVINSRFQQQWLIEFWWILEAQ